MKDEPFRQSMDCPFCGHVLEATTGLEGAVTPVDGNLSICLYCGGVAEFADNVTRLAACDVSAIGDPEERARVERIRDTVRFAYTALKDKSPPPPAGNRRERRARKARGKKEFPPQYVRTVEMLGSELAAWQAAGHEAPLFALPHDEILFVASLDHIGPKLARNDAARAFLPIAIAAGMRAARCPPTVFQLGVALEIAGVPIDRETLSELGLSPTGGMN